MGLNTSVMLMNDSLDSIERDDVFGATLAHAMRSLEGDRPIEVWARSSLAGYVIETHHSSMVRPILIGGNCARPLEGVSLSGPPQGYEESLLRQLAHKLGYRLVRRKK